MAHLAAILFFSGLLVALGLVIELTLRESWAQVKQALLPLAPATVQGRGAPQRKLRAAA